MVSIMLGTNDAKISENISIDDYKANIETMITSLKNAGIKKIILNEPPYLDITRFSSNFDNSSLIKLMGYSVVLGELADGETVIIGDTQTYEYFENHLSELGDGAHPNSLGHQHLGEFRAEAIKSAIEYQINPDHHFISGDSHTLQTT
ncbi:hypothetical protein FACS189428_0600 [Clostridia bacterium]|nr:hypothetical protein FACS189428_0600 [Clostridia bacterium]